MLVADVARRRLSIALSVPVDVEHAFTTQRYRCAMSLPRMCFVVEPGLMCLKEFRPDRWPPRDWLQFSRINARPFFSDASAALDETAISVHTLEAKKYVLYLEHEVLQRAPLRIDRSGNWKRHPPSKRRHMRSWRYASDLEKLRHAPFGDRFEVLPWWARHPDERKRTRLGTVEVTQELFVYAQSNAPIEDLFKRHSDEWCGKIAEALQC